MFAIVRRIATTLSSKGFNMKTSVKTIRWQSLGTTLVLSNLLLRKVFLRIDGRGGKGYRLDRMTLTPWEAIDEGIPFDTLQQAQDFAQTWLQAVQDQDTLFPKIER